MHVVSTDSVPASDRFGFWREISSRTWVPYDSRCEPRFEGSFQARMGVCELGDVQIASMKTTPYEIHRTTKLIRQADPGLYKLSIAVRGAGAIAQDDRHAEFTVGDLIFYDTSRPYSAALATDIAASELLVLRFPRSLLPLPPRDLRRLTAVRIPGTVGVGALTSQFLMNLAARIDEYSPADTGRVATLALDVLTTAFAHALDAGSAVPPQTRQRALFAQVQAFIQGNLDDSTLAPGSIAAAHHISLRYLHKLFHQQGLTVASWIRERRLEQCRRELADPRFAARPISVIAARWGFTSQSHFSQAFRGAYGLSPRQFREHHATTDRIAVHGR